MTLYELKAEAMRAYSECIDEETGEVINPDKLNEVCGDFNEKVENTICYIKSLQAFAGDLKEERDNITERINKYTRKIDGLKKYLSDILEGQKFEGVRGSISYRRSFETLCDIDALRTNDDWERYVTVKTSYTPDKEAIKKAIQSGEEIAGATVVEKNNLQIK